MTPELRAIAARVKRGTSNSEVLELCDAILATTGKPAQANQTRRDYMKEYMRKYRLTKRQQNSSQS